MILLERYIIVAVLRGVAIVLLVLLSLSSFIEIVGQLDEVGTGSYTLAAAVSYVALRLPGAIFELLPAAALIGALLSLGNLAVHRELIVMRASGVSVAQLAAAVGAAGLILMALMVMLGESLAPSMDAYAREMRTQAMLETTEVVGSRATWFRSGEQIFRLGEPNPLVGFEGILLVELGGDRALRRIARADSAEPDGAGSWILSNYAETEFQADRTIGERAGIARRDYDLSPELLGLSVIREDLLTTPALERYIAYLRDSGLDASRYLIAFWARLSHIVSVGLMTLLALPFVFGSLRSSGAGARLLIGLIIGMSYYVAGHTLTSGGQVFDLDPRLIAWAPSAVLLAVTMFAFARIR